MWHVYNQVGNKFMTFALGASPAASLSTQGALSAHDITAQPSSAQASSAASLDDITALRREAMRFRATFEQAAIGIAHVAPDGRWLRVNRRLCTMLGYTESELLSKTFQELTHPADLAADVEQVAKMLAGELQTFSMRKRYHHKLGHLLWANLTVSLVANDDGSPDYFVSFVEDITSLIEADEALRAKIAEEQTFQEYLKRLHEITIALTAIDEMDDFYRQIIELGLTRLGFDRLGLLFYDTERNVAIGTYGTDAQGNVVAEPHIQLNTSARTSLLHRARVSPDHFALDAQTQLFSNGEPIGRGWNAAAVLWDGQQGFGWLVADNGVHQQPVSKACLDILALYSLTIGTLLGRKQSESALRKSEEKFRLLVDAAPLAIIISDQVGQITLVNRRAELLFAYPRDQLIGQAVDMLVPTPRQAQHALDRAAYVNAPRIRQMGLGQELHAKRSDGHEFPVEIELSYIKTATGLLVMSFILDISERKRTAEAIREQRDFLQLVIDSVPDLITVNDRHGYFQMVNEHAAKLYGLTAADMVGKRDIEVNPNQAEVSYFLQTDQAALDSAQMLFIPEQTILGRYYQTSKIPLHNQNGPPDRLLVVSSDITQRKEAEAGLQQALAKERELSELKSRFLSMASHEFRTPLTTILALAGMLRDYWPKMTNEKITERLNRICDQVGYLEGIMEDVLQLARFQAGRTPFKPVLIDLAAFCRTILDEFQSRADVKHRLLFRNETTVGLAALDQKLMRKILNNLIANAIKYSPADKTVQISLEQQADALILQVQDEGIGIPPADLNYIFEPFHRATNVEKIAGTGLGLTITKEAVELHHGRIRVESQVGVGTTFTISLPMASRR